MSVVIRAATFLLRHLLIVPALAIVGCVLWTIVYVVLLLAAMVFDQGVGGPLAYPAGLLMVVVATMVVGWGVFAPASAIGAVFCGVFRLPRIAAIPIVFLSAFFLSYLLYWAYIHYVTTHSMPSWSVVLKNFTLFLSVPLGVYWWLAEGPGALWDMFRRLLAKRTRVAGASEAV